MTPTVQQETFLEALINTNENLSLVARAGCGKTSTILLAVDAVANKWPTAEIAVCAYNKSIADEVSEKLKLAGHTNWRTVQASTLHSMGFGLVKFIFKPFVDDKKIRKLIATQNDSISAVYSYQIEQLVRYAKQAGVGFFSDSPISNVQVWYDLADHFNINGVDDMGDMDQIVDISQKIYSASLAQTDVIDFDDMILFPLIKNLRTKFTKDFIFLDEAQDLSRARQALARKFLKAGSGRMIIVGDDRQAIYGFSGADAAALDNLTSGLNAKKFPLSITWRCPKAVVALAQRYVPDIQAAPNAPEGEVMIISMQEEESAKAWINNLVPNDAILCRNTAPLITLAYKLIRAGKAVKVEGRQIGEGLQALAKRWKVNTIDDLLNKLDIYRDREIQKAMAKSNESKIDEINDRVDTLVEVCAACILQGKTTVNDVCQFIDNLFADDAENVIICATYHRAKGREWDRVYLWEHYSRCPSRFATQQWEKDQESNLAYVAITRAKRVLGFVS
jgi:superfamily I DNA/RNA helicase